MNTQNKYGARKAIMGFALVVDTTTSIVVYRVSTQDYETDELAEQAAESLATLLNQNQFPNGFDSWHETHYEMVSAITMVLEGTDETHPVYKHYNLVGTGGMYDLAKDLTDKFEATYEEEGKEGWINLDYFETCEEFFNNRTKRLK